eukprot:COSAG03_NODE_10386_length_654_cov_0.718919_1_plen_123_part_10
MNSSATALSSAYLHRDTFIMVWHSDSERSERRSVQQCKEDSRLCDFAVIDWPSHHEAVKHIWKGMDLEVTATCLFQLLRDKTAGLNVVRVVATRTKKEWTLHRGGEGCNITADLEGWVKTNPT